jgi:hypothetical protein
MLLLLPENVGGVFVDHRYSRFSRSRNGDMMTAICGEPNMAIKIELPRDARNYIGEALPLANDQ